jgi:hypothetical protein
MRKSKSRHPSPTCSMLRNSASSEKVTDITPIPPPDWEALISLTADEILSERSPAQLLQVRARLYDLLTHCIPATTIIKVLDNPCLFGCSILTFHRP